MNKLKYKVIIVLLKELHFKTEEEIKKHFEEKGSNGSLLIKIYDEDEMIFKGKLGDYLNENN